MRGFLISSAFILAILAGFWQPQVALGRSPSRDGVYPGPDLLTRWASGGPKMLWKYETQ